MTPDASTERLRALLNQIISGTTQGAIQWERQTHSAHRYARWNNNLLILGPDAASDDKTTPRYLFITPFDSPDCIEINSNQAELGPALLTLVSAVEVATAEKPPTDPFQITNDLLVRLSK
jgi:hypothetical protein